MTKVPGTTKAQTIFLRAFRTDPFGPGVEKWPSPAILRRWLRRPGFVLAMRSIRDAIRYQADFQLLAAAGSAAHALHTSVAGGDHELQAAQLKAMSDLMKLAHIRQRFAPEDEPVPRSLTGLEHLLCTAHPNGTVGNMLAFYELRTGRDLRAELMARAEWERSRKPKPVATRVPQWHDDAADDGDDDRESDADPARESGSSTGVRPADSENR